MYSNSKMECKVVHPQEKYNRLAASHISKLTNELTGRKIQSTISGKKIFKNKLLWLRGFHIQNIVLSNIISEKQTIFGVGMCI